MSKNTALLIDIQSIQEYLFSTNKLKINLGASYILTKIFDGDEITKSEIETGYKGGGNALLFFEKKEDAIKFIRSFSLKILKDYPGLSISFAIEENFNKESEGFQDSMNTLHTTLQQNKSMYPVETTILSSGLTVQCQYSGEPAIKFNDDETINKWVSESVQTKLNAYPGAKMELNRKFNAKDNYSFASETEDLPCYKEKNYIAYVHIDGNQIGNRFKSCTSLDEYRILSQRLNDAAINSFQYIVEETKNFIEDRKEKNDPDFEFKKDSKNKSSYILPIIPIVIGGDDITFLCDASLAIWLSKRFIDKFSEETISFDTNGFTACAGIAIVKSKFPFYKAYKLSKELTDRAKNQDEKRNTSYIDFLVMNTSFSGSLEEILRTQFTTNNNSVDILMHNGPYDIGNKKAPKLEDLLSKLKELNKWNRSKVMRVRELIIKSEIEQKPFKDLTEHLKLSEENNSSIYFDAIELLDLYPECLV